MIIGIFTNYQIVIRIIMRIAVDVMYLGFRRKRFPHCFFYNKVRLFYISIVACPGVVW